MLRIRRSRGGGRESWEVGSWPVRAGGSRGFLIARRDRSGSGFEIGVSKARYGIDIWELCIIWKD